MAKYNGFKSTSKLGSVISNINSNHRKLVKENREYIQLLIETLQ